MKTNPYQKPTIKKLKIKTSLYNRRLLDSADLLMSSPVLLAGSCGSDCSSDTGATSSGSCKCSTCA